MNLKGEAELQCTICNQKVKITHLDFEDFDTLSVDPDRSMGEEITYGSEFNISCSNCEQEINGTFIYIEYPIGAFNYEELQSINNADLIADNLTAY